MNDALMTKLEAALDQLPQTYPGPGGVAGMVKDGKVVARRSWGYKDLGRRLPMMPETRLPICSISKQFTCGVLLAEVGDPAKLDPLLPRYLPKFREPLPSVRNLCDMQSGLRDYWALTVVQGAQPEGVFAETDAEPLIARMKTGHFAPGSQYSYSNGNFRLLPELLLEATGQEIGTLYQKHIFGPAGMATACQSTDTSQPLDEVVGYEGNDQTGHIPVVNRICWKGDAGISASLEDMLAYEAWIDATRDDPDAIYNRLSVQPSFSDGSEAYYGYGLKRDKIGGRLATGHGGALRGFRAHRLHIGDERLSVVVMFNHEADALGAALALAEAALGHERSKPLSATNPEFAGQWLDEQEGLLVRLDPAGTGMRLRYGASSGVVQPRADGALAAPGLTITLDQGRLSMRREVDHHHAKAVPIAPIGRADGTELAGRFYSEELEAYVEIEAHAGALFAGFKGLLGRGPMERMHPIAKDIWVIATRRSLDAPAPGDWTVQVVRGTDGSVTGLTIGCWLARRIAYTCN